MKKLLTIFLLLLLKYGNCQSQAHQLISVPLITENKEIDSLLDTIIKIKEPYYPQYADRTKIKGDSCWRIEIYKEKYLLFQMAESGMPAMNYQINRLGTNISSYGYFKYRGHNIFVWINYYFDDFFTRTSAVTTFPFIYKLNKDEPPPSPYAIYRNVQIYKYFDGRFSPYVNPNPQPPVVTQIIK